MRKILQPQELKNYRDLPTKIDVDKLNECIDLAEGDLRGMIGDTFYFRVNQNAEQEDYAELLEGGEFDVDGTTYIHQGLKAVLADLSFSRYLYVINMNITPFGATIKTNQDSQPMDRATLKDMQKQAMMDANRKWELVEMYVRDNNNLFNYDHRDNDNNTSSFSTRFTVI